MRYLLLAVVLACSACGGAPSAPSTTALPPLYVVIGDSIAWEGIAPNGEVLGQQWPIVEATIVGSWRNYGVGGTTLRAEWQPGGVAFEVMHHAVTTTPTAFLMHIGANDTVLQPPPTEAGVFADLQRLAGALERLYPGSRLYLADVGQVWTYGDKRAENAEVRAAIERAWHEIPNVRQGPVLRDLTPDNGVHFTSPANVQTIAERWIQALR